MDSLRLPEKQPKYQVVNEFKFAPGFKEETIRSCLNYKAKADDIFIVTYPKCGTTWTQQIFILLFNDGILPDDVKVNNIYQRSPFLESQGAEAIALMPAKGAMKTHLSFELQPYHPDAKYIYVARNPKDACVSFYYHTRQYASYQFDGDFHDYFKCWLLGEVECGDYREHLLSWWKHRNDRNVLFMLYEDMKSDTVGAIKRFASFIDPQMAEKLEKNPAMIDSIISQSNFEFMQKQINKPRDGLANGQKVNNFIRKGIIGDWRNHFTSEENEIVNQWFHEKFDGTGVEKLWEKYEIF